MSKKSVESGKSWKNEFEIIEQAVKDGNPDAAEIARSVFEIVFQRGAIDAILKR